MYDTNQIYVDDGHQGMNEITEMSMSDVLEAQHYKVAEKSHKEDTALLHNHL